MNAAKMVEMNALLTQMRSQLVEGEEAFGPDSDPQSSHSGNSKGGTSGTQNDNNIWDAFDFYIGDIVDDLLELYEIDEEEATDFIFMMADEMAEAGKMPPIPDDDNDEKGVALWLGSAGSSGFERMVLDAAEAEADSGSDAE